MRTIPSAQEPVYKHEFLSHFWLTFLAETSKDLEIILITTVLSFTNSLSRTSLYCSLKTSFVYSNLFSLANIKKHLISEWNFPKSYSDDYDVNEENFRKVCTDFVGKHSITGNEIAEIRYKQGVSLKIHSGLNIDLHE